MLLDTSGLLCLLHRQEPFHEQACSEYKRANSRVTHSFVLAEFVALANARGMPQPAVLAFLRDLLADPEIHKVWVNEFMTSQAIALLTARQDRGYSLCDAVSFIVMRERNVEDALTTDHHFDEEGFQRLLV
jgi:predicted nucleic acid-binding protein